MSLKRVAILVTNLSSGGAERIAVNVANGLAERGYAVDLVMFASGGAFSAFLDRRVNQVPLDTRSAPWRQLKRSSPLRRYLVVHNPDLVLSFGQKMNRCLMTAAKLCGYRGKLVISERNRFTEMFPNAIARFTRRALLRYLYRAAHSCICVSEGVKTDFLENKILTPPQATVIYNPVATGGGEDAVAHSWFSDRALKIVLGVGSLNTRKDFETLLRAFALLAPLRDDLRLVILGEGSHRRNLETLAARFKLESKVSLPGFVPTANPYIAKASVLVMSSKHEGFGNVLVESLACGTNVVSTDCPSGPSEILEEGLYGWLVPVGDAPKMAAAIEEALANPKSAETLRARAEHFSVARGVENYAALIDGLLKRAPE